MKIIIRYIFIPVTLLFFVASCGDNNGVENGDILVKVGKAELTVSALAQEMPYGLTESDSVKFARAYIRSWIDSKLVGEIAARNIDDMEKIDVMVDKYRNELIMWEYRQRMYASHADKSLSPDSIAAYYEKNKSEFVTERPLIKGIYIKIPDNAPNIDQLKKWYRSTNAQDIEKLEKYSLSEAIHYDYFRDRWIDWEQVESKIPHDFGVNPDNFIKSHKYLETSIGGFTYLLSISEYLPSGSIMPLDVASIAIKDLMINRNRVKYDSELRKELYDKGVEDGEIKILCDLES